MSEPSGPLQTLTPAQAKSLGLRVPEGTEKVLLYGAYFQQFVQSDPEFPKERIMNKYKITKKVVHPAGPTFPTVTIEADEIRDTGQFVDFYRRTNELNPVLVYRMAVGDVHSVERENA